MSNKKGKFWYLEQSLRFEKKIRVKIGRVLGRKSNLIYHLPVLDSVRLFQSIYRVPKAVFAENLARYSQALQCDGFLAAGGDLVSGTAAAGGAAVHFNL